MFFVYLRHKKTDFLINDQTISGFLNLCRSRIDLDKVVFLFFKQKIFPWALFLKLLFFILAICIAPIIEFCAIAGVIKRMVRHPQVFGGPTVSKFTKYSKGSV